MGPRVTNILLGAILGLLLVGVPMIVNAIEQGTSEQKRTNRILCLQLDHAGADASTFEQREPCDPELHP